MLRSKCWTRMVSRMVRALSAMTTKRTTPRHRTTKVRRVTTAKIQWRNRNPGGREVRTKREPEPGNIRSARRNRMRRETNCNATSVISSSTIRSVSKVTSEFIRG
uniref:(northern house mosquito) hypothetical protein n=1 Tax=Culex pipiens TaxID=7175 RepID=A0A8D8CMQ7_CULPI